MVQSPFGNKYLEMTEDLNICLGFDYNIQGGERDDDDGIIMSNRMVQNTKSTWRRWEMRLLQSSAYIVLCNIIPAIHIDGLQWLVNHRKLIVGTIVGLLQWSIGNLQVGRTTFESIQTGLEWCSACYSAKSRVVLPICEIRATKAFWFIHLA